MFRFRRDAGTIYEVEHMRTDRPREVGMATVDGIRPYEAVLHTATILRFWSPLVLFWLGLEATGPELWLPNTAKPRHRLWLGLALWKMKYAPMGSTLEMGQLSFVLVIAGFVNR